MRQSNKNHIHPNDPGRPSHFRGERFLPPYTHAYTPPADPWHGSPHVLPRQRNLAAGLSEQTRELPNLEMLAATMRLAAMGIHETDETGLTPAVTELPAAGSGAHASQEVAQDIGHVPQHLARHA